MVNTMMIVAGMIGLGAIYILMGDMFSGKNKAIVFHRGVVQILKAIKTKDGNEYIFKHKQKKYTCKPDNNEYDTGKYTTTFWELKNNIMIPITKVEKKIEVENLLTQKRLADALKNSIDKIDNSWWDKNKDYVVGLSAIVGGVFVYVISVKYAGDISPTNLNACLQIAADIQNSTQTTESNINKLVQLIGNTKIPN